MIEFEGKWYQMVNIGDMKILMPYEGHHMYNAAIGKFKFVYHLLERFDKRSRRIKAT